MIHHSSHTFASGSTEAGRQVAQLRHVLALIEEIAGQPSKAGDARDEMVRIGGAYDAAPPIVQRRFDAFAAETADWAAVGVKALIAAGNPAQHPPAAARRLAEELARAISKLGRIVA